MGACFCEQLGMFKQLLALVYIVGADHQTSLLITFHNHLHKPLFWKVYNYGSFVFVCSMHVVTLCSKWEGQSHTLTLRTYQLCNVW